MGRTAKAHLVPSITQRVDALERQQLGLHLGLVRRNPSKMEPSQYSLLRPLRGPVKVYSLGPALVYCG